MVSKSSLIAAALVISMPSILNLNQAGFNEFSIMGIWKNSYINILHKSTKVEQRSLTDVDDACLTTLSKVLWERNTL
jgi:hypothetical protein